MTCPWPFKMLLPDINLSGDQREATAGETMGCDHWAWTAKTNQFQLDATVGHFQDLRLR